MMKIKNKKMAQIRVDYLYSQGLKHGSMFWKNINQIRNIIRELRRLEKKWGVKPTKHFVGKWIDI